MANKKKLQKAAVKFRRENALTYKRLCIYLSYMSDFIREKGVSEVEIDISCKCYASTNN